ncbi:MAG: hypothetical protein ABI644_11055 [Arenimonas sp.]
MISIVLLVLYLAACFRVIQGISTDKSHLIERGASSSTLMWCQLSMLLFIIPLLTPFMSWPVYISESFPLPLTVLFFLPSALLANHILGSVPAGGYDYQRAASAKVREVIWVAAAGAGYFVLMAFAGVLFNSIKSAA